MPTPNIKELVSNKQAVFTHFRHNTLYYEVRDPANLNFTPFPFGVPAKDAAGDASFPAQDKSMMFMKWISKQLKLNAQSAEESLEAQQAQPSL